MSIASAFRKLVAITLLVLSASCARRAPGPSASAEGPSWPGPRAEAADCLRYPANVVPPVSDALAASGPHAISRILVAASGRVALLDDRWRLMVWNPAAGREAWLLPGAFSRPVAGAGDVLFQRNSQGDVTRLALLTGMQDAPRSDECGEAGVVSSIRGAQDRPVVGLIPRAFHGGGAVIRFGEGIAPGCTVAYRTMEKGWTVEDAQASRDLLVVTETGSAGAVRAVFHRHDNTQDRIVEIDDLTNVEIVADTVVFWSGDDGNILVASMRDSTPAPRPVALFPQLQANQWCVNVETTAGRFILFRNECAGPDGGAGATQRVLFDATEKRTVAKLDGLAGPVGVTPEGRIIAAGSGGVCTVREK